MKKQLDLQRFDLKNFLEQSIISGEEIMSPNVFSMNSSQKYGDDELKKQDVDVLYRNLLQEGKYVFVNFSSSAIDQELSCIDGATYLYIKEEDVEEYFDNDEIPSSFYPVKNLEIYEDSSVGYLLSYKDGKLNIQTAVIEVSTSTVQVQDDVEVLNKPMELYLEKFII